MNNSTSESPAESEVVMDYTVKFIILLIITVLVYVCNIIVMVVLCCSSTIPYHQKYLMFSLCCTDLSMAVLLTLSLVTSSYDRWIFGNLMCWITTLVLYVIIDVTFLTLSAMILDKYLLVRYPMKYQRLASKKVVILCVICIWCWSTLSLILLRTVWKHKHFYSDIAFTCHSTLKRAEDVSPAAVFNFCTSLIPSILTGVVCNIKIYLISTQQQNRVSDFEAARRTAKVNVKGLKTILIASGLSLMSTLPGLVMTIMGMLKLTLRVTHTVQFFLYYVVVCNSFANCFIYSTTHLPYQKAQQNIIRKIKVFCVSIWSKKL